MTNPPTLSEMQNSLTPSNAPSEQTVTPPSLSEMSHALVEQSSVVVIEPPTELVSAPSLAEMYHALGGDSDELAHFGIKGMKWGVRRTDAQLGYTSLGKAETVDHEDGSGSIHASSKQQAKVMKGMKVGDTLLARDEDGTVQVYRKKADGTFEKDHISADAERFMKTLNKSPERMSDAELKAATNRATQLQNYNKLFGADNKSDLERAVHEMKLMKEYKSLKSDLTPEKTSAVNKLVSASQKGFAGYKAIDDILGGAMTDSLKGKLGLTEPLSVIDQLKFDNELGTLRNAALSIKTKNVEANAKLNTTLAEKGRIAVGDKPSLAVDYLGAGKRSSGDNVGKRKL